VSYGAGGYTYELVDGWAKLPEGFSFLDVAGLFVDSQDRVYVFSRSDHPVAVFDREGNLLTWWGEGFFKRCHNLCAGPDGCVYCADDGNHTVSKFTFEGKLLMTLGNKDQPSDTGYSRLKVTDDDKGWRARVGTVTRSGPPFNAPTGVALSASGEIYVSDGEGNARIHKFAPDGTLLFSWGEPGRAPGQFRTPHSVRVDKQEHLWVVDRQNYRIQIFNHEGAWIGVRNDVSKHPNDVWVDDEAMYVAEQDRRISIFTIDGKLLTRFGNEGERKATDLFWQTSAIAVDSHGDIYAGDTPMAKFGIDRGPRVLQKFARKT
jgi:DNA-binding beta-propeller fold protein YncE